MRSLLCSLAASMIFVSSVVSGPAFAANDSHCDAKGKACATSNIKHVKPGLVAWRDNFEAAKRQAMTSGKPVMLFVMLGKLDEEFC